MACRRDSTIGVIARPVCLVCRFINSRLPQAIGFRHTYRLTPRVLGGCVSEPPANLCAPSGGAVYGVSRCPGASVWPLRCPGLGLGSPVQFLAFPFWATRLSVRFCLSSVLFCLVFPPAPLRVPYSRSCVSGDGGYRTACLSGVSLYQQQVTASDLAPVMVKLKSHPEQAIRA